MSHYEELSLLYNVFQYRGRSWEGCNEAEEPKKEEKPAEVSIPRTVVGGLQFLSVYFLKLPT